MKIKPVYKGIFYTVLASIFWGIPQPLFFNQIQHIPAIEVVSHRSIWAFIFLLILISILGKIKEFLKIFKSYKKIFFLSLSAILISTNWMGFIMAVNLNRLQDASMGYFLSPIISITLGYFFLNEKISKLKLSSITLMIISLIFLIININMFPYLAILIGVTWGLYGLIRKQVNVNAEIGLLYESGFISLIALPFLYYLHFQNAGYFLNINMITNILLIFTGIITVFPLFFFNIGIKSIPLGLAGIIFYLTPTFHFITSIFILGEGLSLIKLISFVIIWIAVLIFIIDKIISERFNESNTQSPN